MFAIVKTSKRDFLQKRWRRKVGVDSSAETLQYARKRYAQKNIDYVHADLTEFIANMTPFDYAVSRGAMEHVPGGLELVRAAAWIRRLMFDVPYDEDPGVNRHHVIHNVRVGAFDGFDNAEVFFQDLEGVTYDVCQKPERPNMTICVSSAAGLPSVSRELWFPLSAGAEQTPAGWIGSLRWVIRRTPA